MIVLSIYTEDEVEYYIDKYNIDLDALEKDNLASIS